MLVAAGAFVKMAQLRLDDAGVAFRQGAHAGEAIALIEALIGFAPAGNAVDFIIVLQAKDLTDQVIHRHPLLPQWQPVIHCIV